MIRATLDELTPVEPSLRLHESPASGSDRPLVLVVEDNRDMNRFVSNALADRYRVVSAFDGSEALNIASKTTPDLIVTDIMMAGMSGEGLLNTVRRQPALRTVPVVILTAKADDESRIRLLKSGAQDYLTKPIVLEELRARVGNLLTIKKSRDILQHGLATAEQDLAALARSHVARQREIERARAEAEAANRAKDELLSVVSHELRTPLNVVQGWLWQLKRRGDDAAIRGKALEVIERNLAVQIRLVDDLLDVSRAAVGKLRLRKRLVDLTSVCRATLDANQRPAAEKNLTLVFTEPDAPIFLWGDLERLQQTFSNVLANAIKFTPAGGVISVTVDRIALRARVQVRDTGIGVPPDALETVFEPFSQADRSATRAFGGLGLGLAIVKQIVSLHGGKVSATSDGENQGTTIAMEFPIPAVLDDPGRWSEGTGDSEPSDNELHGVKVLVVDDEPDASEAVRRILEHHGALVRTADSAAEALRLIPQLQPDVLLTDIAMPEADGYELLRRMRALPDAPPMATVALTAYAGLSAAIIKQAGFHQYRTKPIAPKELVSLVASLRRGHDNESSASAPITNRTLL